ncbi:MAG: hypothetical protein ACI4PO_09310 [Faecousia sp.]
MTTTEEMKARKAKNLMFKRPALASCNYEDIDRELDEISEACDEVRYFVEQDEDTMLQALGDDEDAEFEFRMAFCDLSYACDQLRTALWECGETTEDFNDCTVALIGNRYELVGYDSYEEDYFSLTSYEAKLAETEAGKRLMRKTKADMIASIGQALGILISFLDIRQKYDYLKAAFDVLRDQNVSVIKQIKEIESLYEKCDDDGWYEWKDSVRHFNELCESLPDRMWIE